MTPTTGRRPTPRETQIIELLRTGATNRQISAALGITQGTVKVYISRMFDKFGVGNRAGLATKFGKRSDGPTATS